LTGFESAKNRFVRFLFPAESDQWLTVLRIGLALQLLVYCISIRGDWNYFLASTGGGLLSRNLTEAIVDLNGVLIPRLGWCVNAAGYFGVSERTTLLAVWWCLVAASFFLLFGLFSRPAAVVSWLLHLATVKSSLLLSYGMDNLTTIGLFYLMLAPSPTGFSVDARWRRPKRQDRRLFGFFRRVLQIHLCLIYFFGGLTKAIGRGWWDGTNLWRALTRPPFDIISADILVRFKYVFPIAGIGICLLEIGYPFFVWHRRVRRPWLAAILLMHIGIGLAMGMYLFASIMIVLNLAAFGPGILWRHRQSADDGCSFSGSTVRSPNN
jgi:hypothetical protein